MTRFLTFIILLIIIPFNSSAQWTQLGLDIDGEAAHNGSGISVSMNAVGNRLAIGAYLNNGNGTLSGHVRIYELDSISTVWIQLGIDVDGEASGDQSGSSISMNSNGNRIAIGAPANGGNGSQAGHVRVYEWNGMAWFQLGIDLDGEAAYDHLGSSVSMNAIGNRLAIGAKENDGNGSDAGHVRIYEWNGMTWTQMGSDIDGEAANDHSGSSVSLNAAGDRLAVGANLNDGNGMFSGHVRVYNWNGLAWIQLGSDVDGEAMADRSGSSVSMNAAGNRLAIGATENDGNGSDAGHVRIYELNGMTWNQMGSDIDGEAANDHSGSSVKMNAVGNRLAIGALKNDGNGNWSGHVRMYEWNGTNWTQLGTDIDGEAPGDLSGNLSINEAGDRIAIGAYGNDGNGTASGHVRVYQNNLPTTVNEVERENLFSIYPNPASKNLILETINTIGEVAQVTSITGAVLLEFNISKEQEKIDLSNFPNGIYFLKVREQIQKIVISK